MRRKNILIVLSLVFLFVAGTELRAQGVIVYRNNAPRLYISYAELDSIVTYETNGIEAVDLGLSVKWANCNVGAHKPEEGGCYYAWGETTEKKYYTSETNSAVKDIDYDISDTEYDAARKNWGDRWRMPTGSEMKELVNKCKLSPETLNGVKGYRVTGPNGQSIFLPVGGYRNGTALNNSKDYGYYWTSTCYDLQNKTGAWCFYFFNHTDIPNLLGSYKEWEFTQLARICGRFIRAVKDK